MLYFRQLRRSAIRWTGVWIVAVWCASLSTSSAEAPSSPGGRIIEFRGTRRDEIVLGSNASHSPQVRQLDYDPDPLSPPKSLRPQSVLLADDADESSVAHERPVRLMPSDAELSDHLAGIDSATKQGSKVGDGPWSAEQGADDAPLVEFAASTLASTQPNNATQPAVIDDQIRQQPNVLADRGWSIEAWFAQLMLMLIGVFLATSFLVLLLLLVALRRLSLHQNSTIRIQLADSDSTLLRALANRLAGSDSDDEARDGTATLASTPSLAIPPRRTMVVEMGNAPFSAALSGPTFAEAKQAEEQRRLDQEAEILRCIYDQNLQVVEALGECRAKSMASSRVSQESSERMEPIGTH